MNKKLVLYGAGWIGKTALYKLLKLNIPVWRVVDNNRKLWDTMLMGVQIVSPKILKDGYYKVIVTMDEEKYSVIRGELLGIGMMENQDFYLYYKFFSSHLMAKMKSSDNHSGMRLASGFSGNHVYIDHDNKKVYRIIQNSDKENFREIYKICKENDLLGGYVIDTKISNNSDCEEDKLVFEHEYVPIEVVSIEWSPKMIKEAALFAIDLTRACYEVGLSPIDIHNNNIMFYKGRFIFTDFDGLEKAPISCSLVQRLFDRFIYRYIYAVKVSDGIYENIIGDKNYKDIQGYLSNGEQCELKSLQECCFQYVEAGEINKCCSELEQYIYNFINHQKMIFLKPELGTYSGTDEIILNMMHGRDINTVLEIACGNELFSIWHHDKFESIVVAGIFHEVIDEFFDFVKNNKVTNIYPAYMDIASPTMGMFRERYICSDFLRPRSSCSAVDRFKSDCVIALGVMDYHTLNCGLDFSEIIGQLSVFTNRYMVIDFRTNADNIIESILNDNVAEWYNEASFENEIDKLFKIISVRKHLSQSIYFLELRNEVTNL